MILILCFIMLSMRKKVGDAMSIRCSLKKSALHFLSDGLSDLEAEGESTAFILMATLSWVPVIRYLGEIF